MQIALKSEPFVKAEKDKVVTFHYALTEAGEPVESSRDSEPLVILFGHGAVIPGLEQAITGHEPGERFDVSVPPELGYGERRDGFTQRVPKKFFRDVDHLRPGMTTVLNLQQGGQRAVVVTKIGSSVVDVDLNHPMAGKTLNFEIEILDVRDATAEEIAHGHAHAAGGHHHH